MRQTAKGLIDLQGADLTGMNLTDIDFGVRRVISADTSFAAEKRLATVTLRGANLSNTKLTSARLTEANLAKASLIGCTLFEAVLKLANLEEADLTNASLAFANLESTHLKDANLHGVILRGTMFVNTYLGGARNLDACVHEGPSAIELWTLWNCPQLPPSFLRGCGVSDSIINYVPSFF